MPKDVMRSVEVSVPKQTYDLLLIGQYVINRVLDIRKVGSGNNFPSGAGFKRIVTASVQTDYALEGVSKEWVKELKSKWSMDYRNDRAMGKVDGDKGMKYVGLGKNTPTSRPKRVLEVVSASGAGVCDHLGAMAYTLCRQALSKDCFSAWVAVESERVMGHSFCIIGPIETTSYLGGGKDDPSQWVVVDAWPLNAKAVRYVDHFFKADVDVARENKSKLPVITWYTVAQGQEMVRGYRGTNLDLKSLCRAVSNNIELAMAEPYHKGYDQNYQCEHLWSGIEYKLDNAAQEKSEDDDNAVSY